MATPKDADDCDAVETAADFVHYLRLLMTDLAEDMEQGGSTPYRNGSWAHHELDVFLERWAAWLQAMVVEGRPHYPKEEIDPPSWTSLARQLDAVRGYE